MQPKALVIIALAQLLINLTSCSEAKKIDELKDNTSEMRETTKKLNQEIVEVKNEIADVSKTAKESLVPGIKSVAKSTDELFDSLRQGDAANARRLALEGILTGHSFKARVAQAAHYLMSFEFQLLGEIGLDPTPEFRELLYEQAVKEFVLTLDALAPEQGEIRPFAKPSYSYYEGWTSSENRTSAYNALSLALHEKNRKQRTDASQGQPVSMYDLIISAIKLKPLIDNGTHKLTAKPNYVKWVLAYLPKMNQLLQTRYNMFAFGFIGSTTDMAERSFVDQIVSLYKRISIDLSESNFGIAELANLNEQVLQPAVKTTKDMVEIGLRPKFTTMTGHLVDRIVVGPFLTNENKVRLTVNEIEAVTSWQQYLNPPPLPQR